MEADYVQSLFTNDECDDDKYSWNPYAPIITNIDSNVEQNINTNENYIYDNEKEGADAHSSREKTSNDAVVTPSFPDEVFRYIKDLQISKCFPRNESRFRNHFANSLKEFKSDEKLIKDVWDYMNQTCNHYNFIKKSIITPTTYTNSAPSVKTGRVVTTTNSTLTKTIPTKIRSVNNNSQTIDLIHMILNWSCDTLLQNDRNSLGLTSTLSKLPKSFNSKGHYYDMMLELIVEEVRAQLFQGIRFPLGETIQCKVVKFHGNKHGKIMIEMTILNFNYNRDALRPGSVLKLYEPLNTNSRSCLAIVAIGPEAIAISMSGKSNNNIDGTKKPYKSQITCPVWVSTDSWFAQMFLQNLFNMTGLMNIIFLADCLDTNTIPYQRIATSCTQYASPIFMNKILGRKEPTHTKFDDETCLNTSPSTTALVSETTPNLLLQWLAGNAASKSTSSSTVLNLTSNENNNHSNSNSSDDIQNAIAATTTTTFTTTTSTTTTSTTTATVNNSNSNINIYNREEILQHMSQVNQQRIIDLNESQFLALSQTISPWIKSLYNKNKNQNTNYINRNSSKDIFENMNDDDDDINENDDDNDCVASDNDNDDEYMDDDNDDIFYSKDKWQQKNKNPAGSVNLIQGPPGCGKTYFLITLMSTLLEMNASLLLSAASNKAVCVALEYLLQIEWIRNNKRIVLVGVEESVHLASGGDTPLFMKSSSGFEKSFSSASNKYKPPVLNTYTSSAHKIIESNEDCFEKLKKIISPLYATDVYAYTYVNRMYEVIRSILDHMTYIMLNPTSTTSDTMNKNYNNNDINQSSYSLEKYQNGNYVFTNTSTATTTTGVNNLDNRLSKYNKFIDAFDRIIQHLNSCLPIFCSDILKTEYSKIRSALSIIKSISKEGDEKNIQNISTDTTYTATASNNNNNNNKRIFAKMNENMNETLQNLKLNFENLLMKLADKKYQERLLKELLYTADVVFCTISTSGQKFVAKSFKKKKLDFVLIDEAAQVLEPELSNIFCLSPRNMIQVGDFKQLPATVFSTETTKMGRQMSCMQRLIDICSFPYIRLQTQYRMHDEIVHFPNKYFYEDSLQTDSSVYTRKSLISNINDNMKTIVYQQPYLINNNSSSNNYSYQQNNNLLNVNNLHFKFIEPGYSFINFTGGNEQSYHGSVSNIDEAKCIIQISNFLKLLYPESQISIITFYTAQMKVINSFLESVNLSKKRTYNQHNNTVTTKDANSNNIRVFSVDSFQGSESDIVLVSFVRSNTAFRVGFLNDFQRLNVALTRAKHLLICVGDVTTLLGTNTLRKIQNQNQQSTSQKNDMHNSSTSSNTNRNSNITAIEESLQNFDILQLLIQNAYNRNKIYHWREQIEPGVVQTLSNQINNTLMNNNNISGHSDRYSNGNYSNKMWKR